MICALHANDIHHSPYLKPQLHMIKKMKVLCILNPFTTLFPCLLFRQHSYRKTQNGQMVHSLHSSQHGGRTRPKGIHGVRDQLKSRTEPVNHFTRSKYFKPCQNPVRVYDGVGKQEAIWETFSALKPL